MELPAGSGTLSNKLQTGHRTGKRPATTNSCDRELGANQPYKSRRVTLVDQQCTANQSNPPKGGRTTGKRHLPNTLQNQAGVQLLRPTTDRNNGPEADLANSPTAPQQHLGKDNYSHVQQPPSLISGDSLGNVVPPKTRKSRRNPAEEDNYSHVQQPLSLIPGDSLENVVPPKTRRSRLNQTEKGNYSHVQQPPSLTLGDSPENVVTPKTRKMVTPKTRKSRQNPIEQGNYSHVQRPKSSIPGDYLGNVVTPKTRKSRRNQTEEGNYSHVQQPTSSVPGDSLGNVVTPKIRKSRRNPTEEGNYLHVQQPPSLILGDSLGNVVPPKTRRSRRNPTEKGYVSHEAGETSTSATTTKASSLGQKEQRAKKKGLPDALGGKPVPKEAVKLKPPTKCDHCGATKFQFEAKGMCCCSGDVRLACNEYPKELLKLYTARDEDSLHFQKYSRLYNNLFAFSSLGGTFEPSTHKGIFVFKAQGQVYHYLPDLIPMDSIPRYLQLYFYDGHYEKENRLGLFPNLQEQLITLLMGLMDDNPYGKFFRSLKEIEVTEDTRIVLSSDPSLDQRVYNAPTSDEVAVVWSESSGVQGNEGPHIIAYGRGSHTHRIKHFYGCYDPLQYPLLLPKGDSGWHQGLKKITSPSLDSQAASSFPLSSIANEDPESLVEAEVSNAAKRRTRADKRISCREYYAYKFQIRPGNFLLRGGRLFQQFIVDMYVKIENTRLDFLRLNQDAIRADLYQGILDTLHLGENSAGNVGKRIVLPPSFLGGPRDMRRRYLNAMTLVQKYGKPDLFITMTCNPNWQEIKSELAPGEQSQNRPDLVARIFHAKLTLLRKQLKEKKIFGEVAAMINVVEFQKRGLPHAHFLIIFKQGYKVTHPEKFDQYVTAEIPSHENPHLRSAVLRHMMHGPCGAAAPKCACMQIKNGKNECSKGYPKSFRSFTTNGTDSYPLYRRRDTGETVQVRRTVMDNRSVVPYNPYLLAMFDCHLNVEVCSTIKAVKYLYKYVYKGHDRVLFNVADGIAPIIDEIQKYQSGRWVSPPEAAWRIFGFNLFETYPPVQPVPVHTQNQQLIRFTNNEDLSKVVSDEQRAKTMLTEFFVKNTELKEGAKYLYSEFPEHFVWNEKKKLWKSRDRGIVIGRVAHASPGEGERYYLRLLLAHVRGPKSFEDLLTVNGTICASFQEAALRRGILEDDNAAQKCMDEAVQVEMPNALRRLFATILIFGCPNNPNEFWDQYYEALSEDFRHQFPNDPAKIFQETAAKVEQFLEGMGKSFAHFNLAHLHITEEPALQSTRDIIDALNSPVPLLQLASRKQLNVGQRAAYKAIIQHVKEGKTKAFFIDGPGGTGKTFLYGALYAKVRSLGKICLPTATSGIAASNLPTGRTTHSRFKIPLDSDESLTCDVPKQGALACLIREASLIIWDEASMAKKENIDVVNLLCQDMCSNSSLFGGKIVVFGGDFRQVLPVLPRRTQQEAVDASIVSSSIWPQLVKFSLTENIRARADPEFAQFLLDLGNGLLQSEESAFVQIPEALILETIEGQLPEQTLIDTVFPEIQQPNFSPEIFTERAILTPRNSDVDAINSLLIDEFPGDRQTYKSFDSVIDDNSNVYPAEFLNSLCPAGMTPHELILKENSPVILLRNLDPAAGLCNGTRLICKRFFPNMIECEISTGFYTGERVFLPRISLKPSKSSKFPVNFQRKQFPIKLNFAMTINKAQGQTLQRVGVYLPKPCFSHGQLYVALSRARSSNELKVLQNSSATNGHGNWVKNVVSFEMLKRAGFR